MVHRFESPIPRVEGNEVPFPRRLSPHLDRGLAAIVAGVGHLDR